ncbi:hypothetical protein DRB17_19320 [Ferruginivarius sediminum]|uniref:Uncharacterized protein n=1 Tax=Ferruginivarius sediminum TaxID=2661937 RepID=A0A369T4E1_9PROT|nr:hypothetical protein DRB17_19320 [Ferruginivarius sediminum]
MVQENAFLTGRNESFRCGLEVLRSRRSVLQQLGEEQWAAIERHRGAETIGTREDAERLDIDQD